MDPETATDDVTDSIAHIEMQRQDAKKESGLALACREALRKLHELLDRERASAKRKDSDTGHSANIAALTSQIDRIQALTGVKSRGRSVPVPVGPEQQQARSHGAPRSRVRSKGRRTMGRTGSR